MSDKLFKIDDGRLHSCEVPENPARRENGTVNGESSDPKPGIPFNGGDRQELKTAARMADKAVYRTYFGSIGPANMAIFFILAIAFSFCIKFPGAFKPRYMEIIC